MNTGEYDVIVVGGGHAGCEAALAAARLGVRTLLVTMTGDSLACMPCNPSIGGIAKSHLVFELDALGGEMGRNADATGLQFRLLNTRKGPAVQANRAQCDKRAYGERMGRTVAATSGLALLEASVGGLWLSGGRLRGVRLSDGTTVRAGAVVLTPGTFLSGTIHIGRESRPGGRDDAPAAEGLARELAELGFETARLKTGTPPRLLAGSLDYTRMERQPGDEPPPLFSWEARRRAAMFHVEQSRDGSTAGAAETNALAQLPCYLTHTTPETHRIIEANLSRSALYGGAISGTGVRYCPSIEDKIVKFPKKTAHHVFIEPEGRHSSLIYPNGTSNSLPREVQLDLIHSIPGLEHAEIVRWAYAIEYDFVQPTQLCATLETKRVENLFLAGQVNGTTGYEEAAVQGFVAGANAALKLSGRSPLQFSRAEAYIGVLIDDLVTRGTNEPYRMFTSRAEHRLLLRQDNARYRMLPYAKPLGIADPAFVSETEAFAAAVEAELSRLGTTRDGDRTLLERLRRPEVAYADLPDRDACLSAEVVRQVEIRVKYGGYIEREERQIARASLVETQRIPVDFDYWGVCGIKYEAREKLSRICPETLGQASRVPGITPADVAVLGILLKGRR